MDNRIVLVNMDYQNRFVDDGDLEQWALRNCDGFLGTYCNFQEMYPVRSEHVAIKTFYFDNEKSAMLFSLRWL